MLVCYTAFVSLPISTQVSNIIQEKKNYSTTPNIQWQYYNIYQPPLLKTLQTSQVWQENAFHQSVDTHCIFSICYQSSPPIMVSAIFPVTKMQQTYGWECPLKS